MEESSGSKRKREDDSMPSTSLVDLGDALQNTLAYLEQPDRLCLASTCKSMTAAVEAYSHSALTRFMTEHVVDESFPDRIMQKFLAKTNNDPPYRCLLQAAHSTYLSTLNMFPGDRNVSTEIALSEDGSRLVVVAGVTRTDTRSGDPQPPFKIDVWDLEAKLLLRTMEVPSIDQESQVYKVYWTKNSITMCTNRRFLVISDTSAEQIHECRHHVHIPCFAQRNNTTIVFADHEHNAYSFDTTSGEKESIASLPEPDWRPGDWRPTWRFHGILQDRWLMGSREKPIVCMDLENSLAIKGELVSNHYHDASDGSGRIYLCKNDGRMEIYTVNGSTEFFEKAGTFNSTEISSAGCCWGVIGSHVFYEMNGLLHFNPEAEAFLAVKSFTKSPVQRLSFPPNRCCADRVQSNGKELFVFIMPRDTRIRAIRQGVVEIAVYSAQLVF